MTTILHIILSTSNTGMSLLMGSFGDVALSKGTGIAVEFRLPKVEDIQGHV
jgi:hypothetical protein